MTYRTGHIKRNPDNDEVAVRTIFDEELFPHNVWLVATTGSGAKTADVNYVEGWEDVYLPPQPEPEPAQENSPIQEVVEEQPSYVELPPIIEVDG